MGYDYIITPFVSILDYHDVIRSEEIHDSAHGAVLGGPLFGKGSAGGGGAFLLELGNGGLFLSTTHFK